MPKPKKLTSPLSRKDAKNIAGVLNAAAQIVSIAHLHYASGTLEDGMVAQVAVVRDDMGRFLAFFEDGKGFGWAKDDALSQMRSIEQLATDLVAHVTKLRENQQMIASN